MPPERARGRQQDGTSDRRWIVLSKDERFSTLGRARDPTAEEIDKVEACLRSVRQGGYLAVMSG